VTVTYKICPPAVPAMGKKIIKQHYPGLAEAEVTILYLFAHAPKGEDGEPLGPALKHHGWPALAIVKVNPLKDRVAGLPDVTIQIDGDKWLDLPEPEQAALIDHELMHLEVRRGEGNEILSDDIGRPKLKIRPHDFEVCGFDEIVKRHGYHAPEAKAFSQVHQKWTQKEFQWG
jgi:hypothetical protein